MSEHGAGLAGDPVRCVLDQSADRGQRTGLLVGELCKDARELGRCRGRRADGGSSRGAGADGDQVEVLLDAARLVRETPQDVRGRGVPRAVEVDQVGDHIDASGLCLNGNPPAAVLLAGNLDTGGPREPVGDFGPLGAGQLPVVRVKPDGEVEDRPPVIIRAGGERMLQIGVFEVLGPLEGCPDLLLVVQGEVIQARPVGDDRVLRQALVRRDRAPQRLGQRVVRSVGTLMEAGNHRPPRMSAMCTSWLRAVVVYQPQSISSLRSAYRGRSASSMARR